MSSPTANIGAYGIVLYNLDWTDPAKFLDFIENLQKLEGFPKFTGFVADLVSKRRRRRFAWNQTNLERLIQELKEGKVRQLICDDRIKNEEDRSVITWISFQRHLPVEIASVNECVVSINRELCDQHPELIWRIIETTGKLAQDVGAQYGCVVPAQKLRDVVAFAGGFALPGVEDSTIEFGDWRGNEKRIVDKVRGCYWGNFLNNEHVKSIGGLGNLIHHPSVAKHFKFDSTMIFVSTTDNPIDAYSDIGQTRLKDLAELFKPIAMPAWARSG